MVRFKPENDLVLISPVNYELSVIRKCDVGNANI